MVMFNSGTIEGPVKDATTASPCPLGFTQLNAGCFLASVDRLYLDDAVDFCAGRSSQLATFENTDVSTDAAYATIS